MTPEQAAGAVAYIGRLWPHWKVDPEALQDWARALLPYDRAEVAATIQKAAATREFPSLAAILGPLQGRDRKPPSYTVEQLRSIVLVYPAGQRDHQVDRETLAVVQHLGGWGKVGQLKDGASAGAYRKRYLEALQDRRDARADARLGLSAPPRAPETRALPSSAPSTPETTPAPSTAPVWPLGGVLPWGGEAGEPSKPRRVGEGGREVEVDPEVEGVRAKFGDLVARTFKNARDRGESTTALDIARKLGKA